MKKKLLPLFKIYTQCFLVDLFDTSFYLLLFILLLECVCIMIIFIFIYLVALKNDETEALSAVLKIVKK